MLAPVIVAGLLFAYASYRLLIPSLSSSLQEKHRDALRLSSTMGLSVCDEALAELLSLRLTGNADMVAAMQRDALEQIESLSREFSSVEMLVVQERRIIASTLELDRTKWPDLGLKPGEEGLRSCELNGEPGACYARYFPLWRWFVISWMDDRSALAPVSLARSTLLVTSLGTVAVLTIMCLLTFQIFVRRRLNALIEAAEAVPQGSYPQIGIGRLDELGRVASAFNAMVDSLAKKDERLRSSIAELKDSQRELRRAKDRAETANRAKSEFLANMSHEIRTPLNGIMGMIQVLQATELDQEQWECVDVAVRSTRRLTSLLSDILDLSRIEADRLEIRQEELRPAEIMQAIEDIFRHTARQEGNVLSTGLDEAIPETLLGDATRLTQILFNLVGNACRYTRQGRVAIEAWLLPQSRSAECRVLFLVSDNGPGIPEAKMDRVFETFTQAGDTASPHGREHEGAGLGLPLVQRLVRLMGGSACIDSREGEGTAVYVSLPLAVPAAGEGSSGRPSQARSGALQGVSVLLAEDDEASRLHARRVLERQGCRVQAVATGEEALYALTRQAVDCILMDIQMPVLDGVEATKRVRASKGPARDVPIIALTACAMPRDREPILEAGVDEVLVKPLEREALLEAVSRMCSPKDA